MAGNINQTVSWSNVETAYYVNETMYIGNASALTLAAGVVLKFNTNVGLNVQAESSLLGSAGAIFTSYKDDAHLGDANGDGSVTNPAANDWNALYVTGTGSELSGANVLYNTP